MTVPVCLCLCLCPCLRRDCPVFRPCASSGSAVADPRIDCLAHAPDWTTVHTQPITAVADSLAVIYQRLGA